MTVLDTTSHIALAIAVTQKAVDELKLYHNPHDIAFFLDQKRSELWLTAAGLDYDATVSRLRADGHFVAAPPPIRKAKVQRPHTPQPTRYKAYQDDLKARLLDALPGPDDPAWTTRALADAIGERLKTTQWALRVLVRQRQAETRNVIQREGNGTVAIWRKISQ